MSMHCAVSWDIKDRGRWEEINDRMVACFAPYRWHRPLSTFYVVQVNSVASFNQLVGALTAVTNIYPNQISFILTPPVTGGARYAGFLPPDSWKAINGITG